MTYHYSVHRQGHEVNWPLWIILAALGAGLAAFLVTMGRTSTQTGPAWNTGTRSTGRSGVEGLRPIDPHTLIVSGSYRISATVVLCPECGTAPDKGSTAGKMLPAGSQIGVITTQNVDGAKWYKIQAVASDGMSPLGTGWVSAQSLEGQTLKLLQ